MVLSVVAIIAAEIRAKAYRLSYRDGPCLLVTPSADAIGGWTIGIRGSKNPRFRGLARHRSARSTRRM
jgi:hypothetical protein